MVVGSAAGLDAKKAAPLAESLVADTVALLDIMSDRKMDASSVVM